MEVTVCRLIERLAEKNSYVGNEDIYVLHTDDLTIDVIENFSHLFNTKNGKQIQYNE